MLAKLSQTQEWLHVVNLWKILIHFFLPLDNYLSISTLQLSIISVIFRDWTFNSLVIHRSITSHLPWLANESLSLFFYSFIFKNSQFQKNVAEKRNCWIFYRSISFALIPQVKQCRLTHRESYSPTKAANITRIAVFFGLYILMFNLSPN